jgi:hypothetical protein
MIDSPQLCRLELSLAPSIYTESVIDFIGSQWVGKNEISLAFEGISKTDSVYDVTIDGENNTVSFSQAWSPSDAIPEWLALTWPGQEFILRFTEDKFSVAGFYSFTEGCLTKCHPTEEFFTDALIKDNIDITSYVGESEVLAELY